MEELLPLESYDAQSDRALRRVSRASGLAFGAIMGTPFGVNIALSLGAVVGASAGLVAAALTGGAFALLWGRIMRPRMRAGNERMYDNDPRLMGDSLEDVFRYRMPCSLVEGGRLLGGTLYIDQGRAAFVPIRRLTKRVEATMFSLGRAPFSVVPRREAPMRIRWTLGAPVALQVASEGRSRLFLTPDSELVIERLRDRLPTHFP